MCGTEWHAIHSKEQSVILSNYLIFEIIHMFPNIVAKIFGEAAYP